MKFQPPKFYGDRKLYISDIQDGDEFEQRVESTDSFTVPQSSLESRFESQKDSIVQALLEGTKGWFSKPLTQQWLRSKCKIKLQTFGSELPIPAGKAGTLRWKITQLEITKDTFSLLWNVVEVLPDPIIELEEEEPEPAEGEAAQGLSLYSSEDRVAQKEKVLQARRRAARALYKAERLIQEYCAIWGEDTDWEDEDSDSS